MFKKYVSFKPRILYTFQEMQAYLAHNGIPNNRQEAGRWLIENGWIKTTKKVDSKNYALYYKVDENGNNVELNPDETTI